MSMQSIVVDLETTGTKPGCAILSIGAVHVDVKNNKLGSRFYTNIDLKSCVKAGLTIDPDTFLWWMQQNKEARAAIASDEGKATALQLNTALEVFNAYIKSISPYRGEVLVFGNGANFDNTVLRAAYNAVGMETAWSFRHDMCYRTLSMHIPSEVGWKAECSYELVKHNALDDAIYEGKKLLHYLQFLHKVNGNFLKEFYAQFTQDEDAIREVVGNKMS